MDNTQTSHLLHIQEASRQGKLVVFVGAGVSNNSGVPTWGTLIKALKDELSHSTQKETDDLKIAQIYKDSRGYKEYLEIIKKVLKEGKIAYNPIHQSILRLSPVHIITTNYDDLMEQAIIANYNQYDIITKDSDLPYYHYPNKLVKMHGDFRTGNIVLSEEDYYNYSSNFPLIRAFVTSLFTTNTVLFVGFSFDDLNLKIILNGIKTVLNKDMQRVYFLTDEIVDKDMSDYYSNKGINIVSINNPDEYLVTNTVKFEQKDLDRLPIKKGANLYKQLEIIRQLDVDLSQGLISLLEKKLKSYQTEITVLGDGLKYVFPRNEFSMWNYHSQGLQIFSDSIKNIAKELKTIGGKRRFLNSHPKEHRHFLMQQALLNRIYRIDDLQIVTKNNFEKIESQIERDPVLCLFYQLNFEQVEELMKKLNSMDMFYNKKDLLLPYLLCRLGRFYEAYLRYKKIIPEFWSKELYVLYFISLYNLYQIRYRILMNTYGMSDVDGQSIVDEIEQFDLELILLKLPIDNALKQTLKDLFSYKFFSEKSKEADELSRQIEQQKAHANRGGGSINENIYRLVAKFQQTLNFCIRNCIEFHNSYFGTLVKDTIIGILNSHSTKCNQIFGGRISITKIYEVEEEHLFVVIFFVESKELAEIILQCDISEIKLNEKAVKYVEILIDNLHNSLIQNGKVRNVSFSIEQISYIIGNIVLLLGRTANAELIRNVDKLYEVIHLIWQVPICFSFDKYLYLLVKRCSPSDTMAIELLADSILRDPFEQNNLAKVIVKQLKKNKIIFDKVSDVSQLVKDSNWELGLILYEVLSVKIQRQYMDYTQQHINELLIYLILLDNLQVKVKYVDHFEELLSKNIKLNEQQLTDICKYLVALRKNPIFDNIHSLIDKYGVEYEQYKFYLAPLEYPQKENIKPDWILRCSDSEIKVFLKYDVIKEKYKKFMQSDELGKLNYDKLFRLL